MSNFHTSAKVLNFIDTRPKDNVIKGAIQLDPQIHKFLTNNGNTGAIRLEPAVDKSLPTSTFATFDKLEDNLSDFINRLSIQLGQPAQNDPPSGSNAYGLMFEDGRRFVTEENKHLVPQGFMLILTASPKNYAQTFLSNLNVMEDPAKQSSPHTQSLLTMFVSLSADIAFSNALRLNKGIEKLISVIERGVFESSVTILCQLLQIFLVLMGHEGLFDWDLDISNKFVEKISVYVNGRSKIEDNVSLFLSLNIIINVVNKCSLLITTIKEEVKFESLIRHLINSDERILLSVLSLMNLIHISSNNEEKQGIVKVLHSKPFVSAIEIAIDRECKCPDQRVREQLIKIQAILFEELRNLVIRLPTEQEVKSIMEVRPSKFDFSNANLNGEPGDHNQPSFEVLSADTEHFKKLVQQIPPGSLALCAILEYIRPEANKSTNVRFNEIQIENPLRNSVWPIVMAQLSNFLILALKIHINDKTTKDNTNDFLQLILKLERPFHELFGVLVELFHRTWREMHANVDDLDKVLSVVQDQLERAISFNPGSLEELDKIFHKKFSYFYMQKIWERERIEQEELELNSTTIQSLRDHLRPNIEELVLCRKKNFLKRGLVFNKFTLAAKHTQTAKELPPQRWFWRLEENERHLCYTDCSINAGKTENDTSSIKKVSIHSIRKIVYGSEYSNRLSQQFGIKLSKKSQSSSLLRCGLCIELHDDSEQFHLTTNDESHLNMFIEGLQCLMTPQATLQTPAIKAEVERLLNLEVRVRLLDVPVNATADLPVPELPIDFSWIPNFEMMTC
uniref:ELMO domain-containing protein n=1 Tax=Ditylenchus dipsaci TaxID=166011 RepID=A0A915D2T4_9BILA